MAVSYTIEAFREVVNILTEKFRPCHEGKSIWNEELDGEEELNYNLKIPPWICQPYYRLPPDEHKQKLEEKQREADMGLKQKYFDKDGNVISRKRMKKLKRLEHRAKNKVERFGELCIMMNCDNTRGLKCDFAYCRICCRKKCFKEILNCSGHKIFIKDRRDKITSCDERYNFTHDTANKINQKSLHEDVKSAAINKDLNTSLKSMESNDNDHDNDRPADLMETES